MTGRSEPLLCVRNLSKFFPIGGGTLGRASGCVRAADDVSFDVYEGECFGLVGESGSGKTTVGKTIVRALRPSGGSVLFRVDGHTVDVAQAAPRELKGLRRHMQMVFQDPYGSLNPRMTVFDIIGEPLLIHGMRDRRVREDRVRQLLRQVGMNEENLRRYPHAFSGGQRQRIGIARALALHPKLIVADEPVSALDVSVQAQVLNLLLELQQRLQLTYVLVAHDLSVIRHVSDRVAVMYAGRLVELAPVAALFAQPAHPYSEALLSAIPVPDPQKRANRIVLRGEVADLSNLPPGCSFHPRCAYAKPPCSQQPPAWEEIRPGHHVRCHYPLE